MKNGRKNTSSREQQVQKPETGKIELRDSGSLLQYIFKWGEWCEMKLKSPGPDVTVTGFNKEIKFYFKCFRKPLRSF